MHVQPKAPAHMEDDFTDDDDVKETQAPPPKKRKLAAITSDDLQTEVAQIRELYLSSRKGSRRSDSGKYGNPIKHFYVLGAGALIGGASIIRSINSIAAGTDTITRLGTSITNHAITIRATFQSVPNSVTFANLLPAEYRFIIYRNIVPNNTPPSYAEVFSTASTTPPVDPTTPFLTFTGGDILAVRNPNTFDQIHMIHDEVFRAEHKVVPISATNAAFTASFTKTWHIDLHKSNTQFYNTAANNIVTNGLVMVFAVNTPAGGAGGHLDTILYTSDFTFSDADMT